MTDHIKVTHENRVTTIRLSRPNKMNAITHEMYSAMADAIIEYGETDQSRALVITADGNMFTAGNDLADFSSGKKGDGTPPVLKFLLSIKDCPKPVLAAVNGPAIGIGLTMLLHCDLVYAADTAKFSAPFVSIGLVPEAASSMLLPATVGMAVANDLFFTGRQLTAEEALSFGLVARVFPKDELEHAVSQIARQVAQSAPNALKRSKKLVRFQRDKVSEQMKTEGVFFAEQLKSSDFAESIRAMQEKRAPVFP